MSNYFITGTDTGIGKTRFTISLMSAVKKRGFCVTGMKPFATGASMTKKGLVNEDAKLIRQHCSKTIPYDLVNPFVYELPAAPSIAAKKQAAAINIEEAMESYNTMKSAGDIMVIEGIGGWRVPISDEYYLSEFVKRLNLPVILVVGVKLGCINHALLTAEAIYSDGLSLCGWGSNHLDRVYPAREETVSTLKKRLNCPHIADFGYCRDFDPDKLAQQIDPSFISMI